MAIATQSALVAGLAAGQRVDFYKTGSTSPGATGRFSSLFRVSGRPGAAGGAPAASGTALTSASPGALPFVDPASGVASYLAALSGSASVVGTLILFDRLVETGSLSGTVTTAQTVNSAALPRYTDGKGVSMFVEVYSALGSTASGTVTVSYTNQDGVTGRTGTVIGGIPASAPAGLMLPVALQSGDTGVRSVQSVTSTTSTGTAGSFGVTLVERLADLVIPLANSGARMNYADLGLPTVQNGACLALAYFGPSSSVTVDGAVTIAQG